MHIRTWARSVRQPFPWNCISSASDPHLPQITASGEDDQENFPCLEYDKKHVGAGFKKVSSPGGAGRCGESRPVRPIRRLSPPGASSLSPPAQGGACVLVAASGRVGLGGLRSCEPAQTRTSVGERFWADTVFDEGDGRAGAGAGVWPWQQLADRASQLDRHLPGWLCAR
ncbi:hypothetical protein E4U39_007185 [Claviceps sp. Clav50 group G5]|nr:hypothetical protein E4U39_007185 [Claviceps sp. Clav50 group G5]